MQIFRGRIRRLVAPKEPAPGEEAGELNVVPFLDILTNVMVFVLASLAAVFTVSIVVKAPRGPGPGGHEGLSLAIVIGTDGYYVKGAAAGVGPGCTGTGGGVTVPRVSASSAESADGFKFDPIALRRCVRRLKDASPSADLERQVILTASSNVPFMEVVRAMDALRADEKGVLFPEVVLATR